MGILKSVFIGLIFQFPVLINGQELPELQLDSIHLWIWDEADSLWIENEEYNQITFTYLPGEIVDYHKYSSRYPGDPVDQWRKQIVKNEGMTETTHSEYSAGGKGWSNSSRTITSFNNEHFISEKITQIWDTISANWKNIIKTCFKYDNSGTEITKAILEWDINRNVWDSIVKVELLADNNVGSLTYVIYSFDTTTSAWVGDKMLIVKHFDAYSYVEKTNYQRFNDEDTWTALSRVEEFIDPSNGLLVQDHSTWGEKQHKWIYQWRTTKNTSIQENFREEMIYSRKYLNTPYANKKAFFGERGDWFGLRQLPQNTVDEPNEGVWQQELKKIEWFTVIIDTVPILDSMFLRALIEEGVDINNDNVISYSEAAQITSLDIGGDTIPSDTDIKLMNRGVTDISSIHAFINLDTFRCAGNAISNLDSIGKLELTYLDCSQCELERINMEGLDQLLYLDCSQNHLSDLDLTQNINLETLKCSGNKLLSLNISQNEGITFLDITDMPVLVQVCVWELPFPLPEITVKSEDNDDWIFTTNCALAEQDIPRKDISLFPNPFNNYLTVKGLQDRNYHIEIFNVLGVKVYQQASISTDTVLDLEYLSPGVYVIVIGNREDQFNQLILKQ